MHVSMCQVEPHCRMRFGSQRHHVSFSKSDLYLAELSEKATVSHLGAPSYAYSRPVKGLHCYAWGQGQTQPLLEVVAADIFHHQITMLLPPDSNSSQLVGTATPKITGMPFTAILPADYFLSPKNACCHSKART